MEMDSPAVSTKTVWIQYLDSEGKVVCEYDTQDGEDEMGEWEEWMNDNAVEHPGEPEEWDGFELIVK